MLLKWKQQQTPSTDGRYDIQIIKIVIDEYMGTITHFYTPNVHIKDEIELAANPDCKNCGGKGRVQYWYFQDESRVAECPKCSPNDQKAQAALRQWLDFVK